MGNTATKSKKGYPFGFYACALGFTFERCAFYTVKWLLAIWLATEQQVQWVVWDFLL